MKLTDLERTVKAAQTADPELDFYAGDFWSLATHLDLADMVVRLAKALEALRPKVDEPEEIVTVSGEVNKTVVTQWCHGCHQWTHHGHLPDCAVLVVDKALAALDKLKVRDA